MSTAIQAQQVQTYLDGHHADGSCVVIDIRLGVEKTIPQAQVLTSTQVIERADELKEKYKQIFVLCENGEKSQQLTELLAQPFQSIAGGFESWLAAGLPVVRFNDNNVDSHNWQNRYQHQINLAGFGDSAQRKLAAAHVAVVGAGGLGAPALLYLVSAGIGAVTLIDDDKVELSNLPRQVLYDEGDVGLSKVQQAKNKLQQHNQACQIHFFAEKLQLENAGKLLGDADLVIDGSDNLLTRYVINDYCLREHKPWVFAGVNGFELQVTLLDLKQKNQCFRCLYPEQQLVATKSCSEQGVLGTVTGMAAMLQVTEAIKYLTGMNVDSTNQMIYYNVLTHRFKMLKYPTDSQCPHR